MITAETPIRYDRKKYKDDVLIDLYKGVLKPRMIEEKNVGAIAPRQNCKMVQCVMVRKLAR